MKPKERRIMEPDRQIELVVEICELAYQINQRNKAEARVTLSDVSLTVFVKRQYQEHAQMNVTLNLSGPETIATFTALWIERLKSVAHDLQKILDAGQGPQGDAA